MCRIYDVIKELNRYIVEYSFLFPLVQKVGLLKLTKKHRSYNQKHKWVFFSEHSVQFIKYIWNAVPKSVWDWRSGIDEHQSQNPGISKML